MVKLLLLICLLFDLQLGVQIDWHTFNFGRNPSFFFVVLLGLKAGDRAISNASEVVHLTLLLTGLHFERSELSHRLLRLLVVV